MSKTRTMELADRLLELLAERGTTSIADACEALGAHPTGMGMAISVLEAREAVRRLPGPDDTSGTDRWGHRSKRRTDVLELVADPPSTEELVLRALASSHPVPVTLPGREGDVVVLDGLKAGHIAYRLTMEDEVIQTVLEDLEARGEAVHHDNPTVVHRMGGWTDASTVWITPEQHGKLLERIEFAAAEQRAKQAKAEHKRLTRERAGQQADEALSILFPEGTVPLGKAEAMVTLRKDITKAIATYLGA